MHKTLLLCFIHGFKGDDDTFAGFPRHLQALLSHALPQISVRSVTYPKFETRGDLAECVARFRDWLQNQVIDLEVAAGTPSPTIDPSVHVVLVGHSMGGIVAAETLLAIVGDEPIRSSDGSTRFGSASTVTEPSPSSTTNTTTTSTSVPNIGTGTNLNDDNDTADAGSETPNFLFPYITGVLAFDTPYLGISPGVLAYGAESHYRNASSAYSAISSAANAFGFPTSSSNSSSPSPNQRSLPAAGPSSSSSAGAAALNASADAAAAPAWQKWGRYAMFAGAAGAVVAGGAAAYMNRGAVKEGWGWVGGHLEFVGCLMKGEDLKRRVGRMVELNRRRGIGWADLVTVLGKGARKTEGVSVAGGWVEIGAGAGGGGGGGGDGADGAGAGGRTFCALPRRDEWKPYFEPCVNDKVAGEIDAHTSMFLPGQNPGFYALADKAKDRVVGWVDRAWYEGSERREEKSGGGGGGGGGVGIGAGDDDWHEAGAGEMDEEPILVD